MIRMQAMLTVLEMTVLFCGVASGAYTFGGYGGGDLLAQTASYGRGGGRGRAVSVPTASDAPVDEDRFVADSLAKSGTGKMSKYGWFRPELVDKVEARVKGSLNYDTLPARYRKLVDANRSKYFFGAASEKKTFLRL